MNVKSIINIGLVLHVQVHTKSQQKSWFLLLNHVVLKFYKINNPDVSWEELEEQMIYSIHLTIRSARHLELKASWRVNRNCQHSGCGKLVKPLQRGRTEEHYSWKLALKMV